MDSRERFYQYVYKKLLCAQILKAQKDSQVISHHFALLDSACVKTAHKTLVKLTPGLNFINVLGTVFMSVDPKSVKITVKSLVSSYTKSIKAVHKMLIKLTPDRNEPRR